MIVKNKIFIAFLFIFLLVQFVYICYAQETNAFKGKINANNINVRSDSTTNAETICTVNKGAIVEIASELYEWYKIRLPKFAPSFIKKEFLSYLDNKTGTVLKDRVNIRLHPNESSAILGRVNKDEPLKVLKKQGGWYQIEPPYNSFGWIHKKFVNKLSLEDIKPETIIKKEIVVAAEIKPPEETIIVEGIIRPKTVKTIATHKLIGQDKKMFLIKGVKDNLGAFNYHRVKVAGKLSVIENLEYPIIEVSKIEDLK